VNKLLPEQKIQCYLGCGAKHTAADLMQHEKECEKRQVPPGGNVCVPCIGKEPTVVTYVRGIPLDGLPHHLEVREQLTEQLRWWNPWKLEKALAQCVGPTHKLYPKKACKCSNCVFPDSVIRV
jgi:hypothetical protein